MKVFGALAHHRICAEMEINGLHEGWTVFKFTKRTQHPFPMSTPTEQIEELKDQVAKLQAFKEYVHQRLDEAGIPIDPPGEHADAGCRVGQRLDIALRSPAKEEAQSSEPAEEWPSRTKVLTYILGREQEDIQWLIAKASMVLPKPTPVLTVEQAMDVVKFHNFRDQHPAESADTYLDDMWADLHERLTAKATTTP
jgi:hypothetical protein